MYKNNFHGYNYITNNQIVQYILFAIPNHRRRTSTMIESTYKSYDELPLFLNANSLKDVLGISLTSAYELLHQKDFPSVKIGNRIVVSKEKFIEWIDKKSERRIT